LNRAYQGKVSPDGKKVAYRMNNSWDEERRNYRGGQNRPIWIVDLKSLELDPKTGKHHVVNITASGDFPWMMPQWKDVSGRIASMALSPTGKRALVEARGEIFTIPADKGDVRNFTNSS